MILHNKRLIGIVFTVALLLLLPLLAMEFTDEVNWTLSDFITAGVLLLTTTLMIELVVRKVKKIEHRIILSLIILGVFLLTWLEFAVGIFGSPISGS